MMERAFFANGPAAFCGEPKWNEVAGSPGPMARRHKQIADNLAKIRQEIAALGRRLKANARKSRELCSHTERLLKEIVQPEL